MLVCRCAVRVDEEGIMVRWEPCRRVGSEVCQDCEALHTTSNTRHPSDYLYECDAGWGKGGAVESLRVRSECLLSYLPSLFFSFLFLETHRTLRMSSDRATLRERGAPDFEYLRSVAPFFRRSISRHGIEPLFAMISPSKSQALDKIGFCGSLMRQAGGRGGYDGNP